MVLSERARKRDAAEQRRHAHGRTPSANGPYEERSGRGHRSKVSQIYYSTLRGLGKACLGVVGLLVACTEPPPVRPTPHDGALDPSATPVDTASAIAPGVEPFSDPKKVTLEQGAMGTKVTMVAFTSEKMDESAVSGALAKGFREIVRIEKLMSTWVESSEVSRINAAAGKSQVTVGPETLAVIDKSLWIAEASGGVFDITFDSMKGLWKFDEGAVPRVPDKDALEKARKMIDYKQITVDKEQSKVGIKREGTRMNLGGIAKGFAVDACAKVLEQEGLSAFLVQAGGDLYVKGRKPDGTAFRVGVRDPRGAPQESFALMEVEDHAFSTAGDYERAFILDGKRYHHIIDPRTGFPATASRSVTVWAKDAFTADAIDDAVFILGAEKGLALVESIDGAGAVIVDDKNKVWISKRIEKVVRVLKQPTEGT